METLKKITPYIIIAALVAFILFQEGCFGKKTSGDVLNINGKKYEVIKHEIDTFYETKTQTVYRKGKDITHEVEVVKEIPVEVIVTKTEYISDDSKLNELLLNIQQLESEKQIFSTKLQECDGKAQIFSTITTENENIFHYKMSKKDEELDELRRTLDEHLAKPPVEVVVEKETTDNSSKSKLDALQNTLAKVRQETLEKDKKIKELEQTIQEIQKFQDNQQAVYLKGSNLDDKLYK